MTASPPSPASRCCNAPAETVYVEDMLDDGAVTGGHDEVVCSTCNKPFEPSPADWRCPFCSKAAEPDASGRLTHRCEKKPSEWVRERGKTLVADIPHLGGLQLPHQKIVLLSAEIQAIKDYLDLRDGH